MSNQKIKAIKAKKNTYLRSKTGINLNDLASDEIREFKSGTQIVISGIEIPKSFQGKSPKGDCKVTLNDNSSWYVVYSDIELIQ